MKLSILWEIVVAPNDITTTTLSSERNKYKSLGGVAYIAADTRLSALYRLYNGRDHMDSLFPGEGGYRTEGALGSLWTNPHAVPGLAGLERLYNRLTGDHATSLSGDGLNGYGVENTFSTRFAYPRFFNQDRALTYASGGGITEGSDSIAGGAVASWVWNHQEFINSDDYGRYLQSSIIYRDQTSSTLNYNPTEAGDIISGLAYGARSNWHGSPILSNQVTAGLHVTRAIPLEWTQPLGSGGVTQDTPVIYPGMQIGKNLTLDFMGLGPVAKYETHIVSPVAVRSVNVEIPTGYLAAKYASFSTYDAASGALRSVSVPDACTAAPGTTRPFLSYAPASGYGGVIIADAAGSAAMGVYSVSQNQGGLQNEPFHLWDFRNCGSTTKWNAIYSGPLIAGDNAFTTYIINGSVTNVAATMKILYDRKYR